MKINAINNFTNNRILKTAPNNSFRYYSQPSFEGVFDVFKKQPAQKSEEVSDSDNLNIMLKDAIRGDKILKSRGKYFLKTLNRLLKHGKKDNYKGHLQINDKNGTTTVTFGDNDENLGVPSNVNIWQNGKLKTIYNIESVSPQSIYSVSTYEDDKESFFRFINDKNLCFQCVHNDGTIIAHFPAKDGFCQQISEKINDYGALLDYEINWNYKNPENSHIIANSETDAVKYGYDKKNKFWYQKRFIDFYFFCSLVKNKRIRFINQ